MRTLNRLLLAGLLLLPLTACDEEAQVIAPAPPAPAYGSISGTVSIEGTGLAGISVQLAGPVAQSTTTGSDGSFSFPEVIEGNYAISISSIGPDYVFNTTSQSITIDTEGQSSTADFNGAWVRTASVLVTVQHSDGSGVPTSVHLEGEDVDQTLNTNTQGTITFGGLKRGSYTVTLPTPPAGFATSTQTIEVSTGQAAQANFVGVLPVGSISGSVEVEDVGVAGITVQLEGPVATTTTTDASGDYAFAEVVSGDYIVTIGDIPGDYSFSTTERTVSIRTQGQSPIADFNGEWVRTASVRVSVGRANGSSVPTSVRLQGEGINRTRDTDANGVVTFAGLKRGEYTATLTSPPEGFSTTTQSIELVTGEDGELNFVGLLPLGSVSGTVTVEGTQVSGLTVELEGATSASTKTNVDGAFLFEDVEAGNYEISLADVPADYTFATASRPITLESADDTVSVNFAGAWVRTSSIEVTVGRDDGTAVPTTVQLTGEGVDRTQTTDTEGTITFGNLKRGDYTVTLTETLAGFEITEQTIVVTTGEAVEVNFIGVRELLPPEITISSIIDADNTVEREDLDNLNDDVLVRMNVDPKGNNLTAVEFWALEKRTGDVYRIASQRFGGSGPVPVDAPQPNTSGVYELEFYFTQYDMIRRRDGSHPTIEKFGAEGFEPMGEDLMRPYHPIFVDGDYEFHGVVRTEEFGADETFNAIVDVTLTSGLTNTIESGDPELGDRVILRVETDNTDWNDPVTEQPFPNTLIRQSDGLRWYSGDVIVQAFPVIFSAPYNENDPALARMSLRLDDGDDGPAVDTISGGEKVYSTNAATNQFNEDGSITWIFCEAAGEDATPNTGDDDCDGDVSGLIHPDIVAEISTVTRFGQTGTSEAELWFEDLYSGTEDKFRLDNQSPTPAEFYTDPDGSDALPHPANALEGVEGFERTDQPDEAPGLGEAKPLYLGWITWEDDLENVINETNLTDNVDTNNPGIGLPVDAQDNHPNLIYVTGPDQDEAQTVPGPGGEEPESGPPTVSGLTMKGKNVTPELDLNPAWGSAKDTPFSDKETDYAMTFEHWDLFGNRTARQTNNPLLFGVDGSGPSFTDASENAPAEGEDPLPTDPADSTSVYNTYDDGFYVPTTVEEDAAEFGQPFLETFKDGTTPFEGLFTGWTSDTNTGFAGVEGVVMEDWAYGTGTAPGTSRYGYQLQTTGVLNWTFKAGNGTTFQTGAADAGTSFQAYAHRIDSIALVANYNASNSYRAQKVTTYDRAGNSTSFTTKEQIVDQEAPEVGLPSSPRADLALGASYTFEASVSDDVDLKKSDISIEFEGQDFVRLYGLTSSTTETEPLLLPMASVTHTAFGSSSIAKEATVSESIPMNACLMSFDRTSGINVTGGKRADFVGVRTWDHSSPYGLVGYNSVNIASAFPQSTACDFQTITSGIVPNPNTPDLWNFEIVDEKGESRPRITLSGETSTFVPDFGEIEPVFTLYYNDPAGRLIMVKALTPSDSELRADPPLDTGGDEVDARKYRLTYTGPLPTDLIDATAATTVAPGTVKGWTFTVDLGNGHLLIWNDGWNSGAGGGLPDPCAGPDRDPKLCGPGSP